MYLNIFRAVSFTTATDVSNSNWNHEKGKATTFHGKATQAS